MPTATTVVTKILPPEQARLIEKTEIAIDKWLAGIATIAAPYISEMTVGSIRTLEQSIPWHEIERQGRGYLEPELVVNVDIGARCAMRRLPDMPIWPSQSLPVVQWAEEHAAKQVTLVTEETKLAIRETMVKRLAEGMPSKQLATEIRSQIGLNAPQAKAHTAFKAGKVNRATGEIVKPSVRQIKIDLNNKIRQRATMIARTETSLAYSEGHVQGYKQRGIQTLEFNAAGDACPICQPLNGNAYPVIDASGVIPVHPNCRCVWLPGQAV